MPYQSEYTHERVLNDVWSCLREGVKHGTHPFHTPVLANTHGDDPDLRTVVLRQVEEKQRLLLCHTDARSPEYFAVISCQIFAIDWLYLRAAGHLRACYDWKENRWEGEWINP